MILLFDKPNQLCNKIWSQAPLVALCLVEGGEITIPYFGNYLHLFENLNKEQNVQFKTSKTFCHTILFRCLVKCLKIIPWPITALFSIYFESGLMLKQKQFKRLIKNKNKILLLSGWNSSLFNEQMQASHTKLREIYSPNKSSKRKVDEVFLRLKAEFDVIIGVHIRRGDYRQWQHGKYFYEDAVYCEYLKQFKTEMESLQRRVCFLLCSNEELNLSAFAPYDVFQIDNPNAIEDLYGLSLCDFIMGPPSTYSMWASFYGKKPIYFMRERTADLSIADFRVIAAQNIFENGEKVNF